ncbi:hypothetical protein [Thermophilibacter sp.]
MGNLRSRTLGDEFRGIVRDLDGDAEGRAAGSAYLASTHPASERYGSGAWALTPVVLGDAEVDILRDASETMGRVLDKIMRRYLDDASFRALFRLPAEVEELTLMPTGYERLLPFVRLDALFDPATGDVRFCGVSTDSSVGMTASVDVTRAIQLTESYRRFSERHKGVETFDIADGVVATLRETYRSWANAGEGIRSPERPPVGIVDYAESASEGEFADLIERLADEGVYARFVDIRDLRIEEGGDGQRRLVDSEGPVTCVYRRALVSEMLEKPCDGSRALIEAARRGLACVVGGFRTWPVSTNALFPVLGSEAMESVLDAQELAFVRSHVPEARFLERGDDVSRYIAEQDQWLLRPAGAYSVTEAVAGEDRMDRDEWWRVLLACCDEGGVAVRLDGAPVARVTVGGAGPSSELVAGEELDARVLLGLFLFHGEFGGVYARCGAAGPLGSWGRRADMGCLVVRQ